MVHAFEFRRGFFIGRHSATVMRLARLPSDCRGRSRSWRSFAKEACWSVGA